MEDYKKILRVQYHNKIFDVFSDKNHKRTFLEVKKENQKEIYFYPEFKDYLYLNATYNKKDDGILYAKKYRFEPKITLLKTIITLEIASLVYLGPAAINRIKSMHFTNAITKELEEGSYGKGNTTIYIYDSSVLDKINLERCTFSELYETLQENEKIPEKYRSYIYEFINRLEERLPYLDLRILNENLKTLSFNIIPNELWERDNIAGWYKRVENQITLKTTYRNKEEERLNVFHELCHTLNNCTFEHSVFLEEEQNLENLNFEKSFYLSENSYGKSVSEGFTTILTDYLLAPSYEDYFEKESRSYANYWNTASIYYQIMKVLPDYTFYDFLDKNVLDLQERLEAIGLDGLIDMTDATLETNSEITIESTEDLEEELKKLVSLRIINLQENKKTRLDMANVILSLNFSEQEKSKLLNHLPINEENWLYRKTGNIFQRGKEEPQKVILYREKEFIGDFILFQLQVYKCGENYYFAFKTEEEGKTKLIDCISKEELDIESTETIDFVYFIFLYLNSEERIANIDMQLDILNTPQLKEYYELYKKVINTNQQEEIPEKKYR